MPYAEQDPEKRRERQRIAARRKALASVASDLAWKPQPCRHGHAPDHRHTRPNGKTYCNECHRIQRKGWRARKREENSENRDSSDLVGT